MKLKYALLPIFCFLYMFCSLYKILGDNRKTEIVQFLDPGSKKNYNYDRSQVVYFVISKPPRNKDSLLNLVSKHFQSFVPNDTIEKYVHYHHKYYIENDFTRRDYIEKRDEYSFSLDYLNERRNDLLVGISVEPKFNEQKIVFYRNGLYVEKEIKKRWRE